LLTLLAVLPHHVKQHGDFLFLLSEQQQFSGSACPAMTGPAASSALWHQFTNPADQDVSSVCSGNECVHKCEHHFPQREGSGKDDYGHIRPGALHFQRHNVTAHSGHVVVNNGQVNASVPEYFKGFSAVVGRQNFIAQELKTRR